MSNKIYSIAMVALILSTLNYAQTNRAEKNTDSTLYWSSSKTEVSIGWQSQYEPIVVKNQVIASISYRMSNFYSSPELVTNQIGLFNKFGLSTTELFYEFGPEIRLLKNFYLIPQGRVSFAWISGVERGGVGFLYFYGGCLGFIQSLNEKMSLSIEFGTRVLPIDENQNILFVNTGLLFDLF